MTIIGANSPSSTWLFGISLSVASWAGVTPTTCPTATLDTVTLATTVGWDESV